MRQIGTIEDADDAARFGDYLVTLGMPNSVEETAAGDWAIWVERDEHLERAGAEFGTFLANPQDARYADATSKAAETRAEQTRRAARRRKLFVDVRTSWAQPRQWNVPLTLFLILASLVVGIYTRVWADPGPDESAILNLLRIAPVTFIGHNAYTDDHLNAIRHGQVWRLVTPIFLHGGVLHLIFNMFWLRDLGAMIESRRGTLFMLVLVLAAAVISNLAQYRWSGPLFLGMSGVVYALFGYAWLKGRLEPSAGIGLSPETATVMFAWLLICMTGIIGPIANAAHVVGLLVGCAFAGVPYWLRRLMR
jgi:GlpG protein